MTTVVTAPGAVTPTAPFVVSAPETAIVLDQRTRRGGASLTVYNNSGQALRARARLVSVDPAATAWELGRSAATEASRAALLRYAQERLTVEPRVVDGLYCTHAPDLGDGIHLRRSDGAVLAVYGENLFKFAPVLADELATALLGR